MKEGKFYLLCPYYTDKKGERVVHEGILATNQMFYPHNGIMNVLTTLPCKNKIVLHFAKNKTYRGCTQIDEINVTDWINDNENEMNYNKEWKNFSEEHGELSKLKKKKELDN